MTYEPPYLPVNPKSLFTAGIDIRILGILFIISGIVDLFWILSYPEYDLKVFGTTFESYAGILVKYQHPVIHWAIGYGFWFTRRWAYWGYLAYLLTACISETVNQIVLGFNITRTTMIVTSLVFGTYIVARRNMFK